MMATTFSSGDDAVERPLGFTPKAATADKKIPEVYEIDRCCQWILKHQYVKVALQFPDEQLVDSVTVLQCLQEKVGPATVLFILGDTTYGSCCVDEVAAEHYQADSVIHFGPSCLAPTHRLPVLYVFCPQPLDAGHAASQLAPLLSPKARVIVTAHTSYQHAVESLGSTLKKTCHEVVTSRLQMPTSQSCGKNVNDHDSSLPETVDDSTLSHFSEKSLTNIVSQKDKAATANEADNLTQTRSYSKCNRHFSLPSSAQLKDYTVLYLGEEGKLLTNLMMTLNACRFLSYNPQTRIARAETLNVNRELMKRYRMIELAKDARIVGIIAGTLGVSRTKEAIAHLKHLAKGAGKKTYTLVVGKLNVAKLANFLEVDVFVLVACPQNSLQDSKEFLKPVLTPFELEVACNQAREWTGDYVTDFAQLLPGAAEFIPTVAPAADSADVSLINNKLRIMGQRSELDLGSSTVVLRSDAMTVATTTGASSAGEFLASRSWQGLERQLGETPVEKAVEGRTGIAMSYEHEAQYK